MVDKEAQFSTLIDRKLEMLRGVAGRILGDAADADEAVQEALLKAWERFDSFKGESQLSSWVTRITINEAYNLVRKRERERRKIARYLAMQPPAEGPAEDAAEEKVEQLRRAIAALPESFRLTVELVLTGDVECAQAAEMLDCSINTLYWRVHKAKRLLRRKLAGGKK